MPVRRSVSAFVCSPLYYTYRVRVWFKGLNIQLCKRFPRFRNLPRTLSATLPLCTGNWKRFPTHFPRSISWKLLSVYVYERRRCSIPQLNFTFSVGWSDKTQICRRKLAVCRSVNCPAILLVMCNVFLKCIVVKCCCVGAFKVSPDGGAWYDVIADAKRKPRSLLGNRSSVQCPGRVSGLPGAM